MEAPHSIIGPGSHAYGQVFYFPEGDALDRVQAQAMTIYVWGRADYEDAFDKPRHFIFRCAMNGATGAPHDHNGTVVGTGWSLGPHRLGYEAN
jgi:hypothetical protein